MSSTDLIRDAIHANLSSVAGLGQVHKFERYTTNRRDFKEFYLLGDKVAGGFVRRRAKRTLIFDSDSNRVITSWDIRFYLSLEDSEESEIAFDQLIDAAIDVFALDETLGDTVEATQDGDEIGLQLQDSGPVNLSGVLCHGAHLTLTTRHYETPPDAELDDFVTADVEYDTATPDGQIEMEDQFTLPQEEEQ